MSCNPTTMEALGDWVLVKADTRPTTFHHIHLPVAQTEGEKFSVWSGTVLSVGKRTKGIAEGVRVVYREFLSHMMRVEYGGDTFCLLSYKDLLASAEQDVPVGPLGATGCSETKN